MSLSMADSAMISKRSTQKSLVPSKGGLLTPAAPPPQLITAKASGRQASNYTVRNSMTPLNEEVLEILKSKTGKLFSLKFTEMDDEDAEELQAEVEVEEDADAEADAGSGEYDPQDALQIENYYQRKGILRDDSKTDIELLSLEQAHKKEPEPEPEPVPVPERLHGLGTPEDSKTELYLHQKSFVTIFESLALFSVLEEVCLQLTILGHSFPGTFVKSEDADFLTYDERFSMEVAEKDLEYIPTLKNFVNPFIIDEAKVGTVEERMAVKIQKDRAFLQEIISLAKEEIVENRSFEKLKDNVTREDGRRHEEITLMERAKKARQAVTQMLLKIKEFKLQMERDEHNRKEMINHLKDQLHQEKQKGLQDARYTRAWFEAKNTFNFGELEHRADLNRLKIKDLEIQMTRDRLSHKNIESWSILMFEEIQKRIEEWTEKFEKDLDELEKKIRDKNDTIRAQQTLLEGLANTIAQRMVELGPWEEVKEQERQERLLNMRLYYSARKIQRWWRAYMVKHNLYKKKKKKGKGKGKGRGGKRKKS